ncbi:hypothetical protein JW851_04030 [Candidatus Woesearchaeota archaeon]|nr:hypothetical protein [Candidatus Woesearchaeota archaeon]
MDLGRLAQFDVDIEICKNDDSILVRISKYEEKKELENMSAKKALTYAVSFLDNNDPANIAFKFIIAKYLNNPESHILTHGRNPKKTEVITDKNIIDCLKCRMNSAGEAAWYCKLILS